MSAGPSPLLPLLLLLLATLCCQARIQRRCHSPALDRYFREGADWTEPACRRARCRHGRVLLDDCAPLTGDHPFSCHPAPGQKGAEFPDCCPSLECHKPGDDKPCYVAHLDRHFAVGESWTEPGCGLATCSEGGGMSGKGCGTKAVPPGYPCGLDNGDVSLEYPQCCPKITCHECYSERLGRFFGPDEIWTESGCVRSQCQVKPDNSVEVSRLPCGLLASPPYSDCELVEKSPDGDYPDCCPTFRCPGRCFSEQLSRWFSVGEEWTEQGCTRASCDDTDRVALLPCGLIGAGPGCTIVDGNTTADYPGCCATVQCETEKPCYVDHLDRHFAVGESWTLPDCEGGATCGEGGSMSAVVCALMGVLQGHPCGLDDGDVSLEYPQCCPKITCRECYSERLGRFFGPDEIWTESGCVRSQCQVKPDNSVEVSRLPCGLLASPPYSDCELVEKSPDGDYPDCCPTFRCPGRCFSEQLSRWFSVGEEWTEQGCTRASCDDTDRVALLPCGLIGAGPGCTIVDGNTTADYPGCCATVQCETEKPCYVDHLDRHFAVGESWTLPDCGGGATCGEGGSMSAVGCALMAVPPGHPCGLDDGDVSLEYPQCCPKITCRECYSERLGRFFGPDEIWTESGCVRNQCQVNPDHSVAVRRLSCDLKASSPYLDCELVEKSPDSDYPDCCPTFRCSGLCFSKHLHRWFPVGQEWTEQGCNRASCVDTDRVALLPCGLVSGLPDPSCELVQAESADYPGCCPTHRCPGRCHSRRLDRWFSAGDSWTEPDCTHTTCVGTDMVVSESCSLDGIQSFCRVVDGEGTIYPDCCPTVECDKPY